MFESTIQTNLSPIELHTLASPIPRFPDPDLLFGRNPKGRLNRNEKELTDLRWQQVREGVAVKLLSEEKEVYVYAQSDNRIEKERSMRRQRLRRLLTGLTKLRAQKRLTRDKLLMKLGALKKEAGRAFGLLHVQVPQSDEPITPETFHWTFNRAKYRTTRRREGRYLLRSNLTETDPAKLWEQLEAEESAQ
jgi:hypothetical protein